MRHPLSRNFKTETGSHIMILRAEMAFERSDISDDAASAWSDLRADLIDRFGAPTATMAIPWLRDEIATYRPDKGDVGPMRARFLERQRVASVVLRRYEAEE